MRCSKTWSGRLAAGLLLIFVGACNGGGSDTGGGLDAPANGPLEQPMVSLPQQPGFAQLPAPSSLGSGAAPQRQVSAESGDWRYEGAEFPIALPHNRVQPDLFTATYTPQWHVDDPLDDLAYACYEFLLPGYDYGDYVQLRWLDPPASGQLWIALADWQRDRWRWFRPETASLLQPESLAPYYDANGRLLVVVALTGSGSAVLDWVSIGNRPPEAVVQVVGPRYGFLSLTATFDPTDSFDLDGNIVKYEWDWQNDGSFDQVSSGPMQHTFTEQGTHTVRLRVTDNLGKVDRAPIEVSVGSSWVHTVGGVENDYIRDVAIAPDGSLWACGTVVTADMRSEHAVLHFDAGGNLLLEDYWKTSDVQWAEHKGKAIAVDDEGNVYVLGETNIAGVLVNTIHCYSSLGELNWIKQIPGNYGLLEDIMIAQGLLYLCGGQYDVVLNASRGLYIFLDLDGNPTNAFATTESAHFTAMAWNPNGAIGGELRLIGHTRDALGNYDLLHASVRYGEQIEYSAHSWGAPTIQEFGVDVALHETELETISMLAATLVIDVDNERSALVRFSFDEAVSCSMDTSKTHAKDLAMYGEKALTLSTNSPGVTSIQQYSIAPGFIGAYGYSSNLLTTPECMESFGNFAVAVGGGAVNGTGSFSELPVSNVQSEDRTWTEYPLTYDFHAYMVEDNILPNLSTRPAGTLDAGGGGQDFWLSMHRPPQIDP